MFGISNPVHGYSGTCENFVFNRGFSYAVIPGPMGRIYWFVFVDTGKTVHGDSIPCYSQEDEDLLVKQHSDDAITPSITFGDLYAARISSTLVPLQEHVYRRWYFQR